jgi:hypothetical protein
MYIFGNIISEFRDLKHGIFTMWTDGFRDDKILSNKTLFIKTIMNGLMINK